ncbi:PAS domain S-box protein [Halorhabdus amylolytica]|uniref:PAS domain S-box protein n=1 Tax=Halorhabdus amylolytica TaxID=2559573 RepID=UPI0010AA1630|nr:PAS domain S-box protein [Halorhabdus amylolytica]
MRESIRVLYVDDDEDVLDLVATMLEREDDRLRVETARGASEAMDRLEGDGLDCVVSDYEMPSRDGLELLDAVRSEYPELPFILFTGKGSEEIASEAISAGVTDYLEKSRGSEQYTVLHNRIENAVERYRASERAATLDRIRGTVRDVNQVLVRSRSRADLERRVCDVVADGEPYEFAWIGERDTDEGVVRPRASAGRGEDYLTEITITLEDSPTTDGPTARAFRENDLAVTESIAEDEAFAPWRKAALERGFRSSAAVPLSFEDEQYGVLNVYCTEPEPFDETEMDLLRELGGDVGHALHRIEQERQYRRLFEESINAIAVHEIVTDEDGKPVDYVFLDVNNAFENMTGLERDGVLGERVTDVLPDVDPTFIERYGRVVLEDEPVQFDHYAESLDAHYGIAAFPLGRDRFVTTFNDITTLVERDRELAETNTLLSALLENLPFGVLVENPDREIMATNPAFCEIFDLSIDCEELVGEDCAAAAAEVSDDLEDPERFLERIEEVLDRGEPTLNEQIRMTDGRTFFRSYVPFSLPEGDGNLWLYRDVTDRIERERELEQTNEQLKTLRDQLELALETTNAYTFDWYPEDEEIRRYPTFEDVFGIDSAAVKPVFDAFIEIVPPDHRDRVKTVIEGAIEDGTSYDLTYPVEPGDERIWVREQAEVMPGEDATRVVGTVTDVTALKQYERELERHNERLDEFAEVVSHDLRNPLNVATGRATLLDEECESEHTGALLDALDRMGDIVDNTLTLARQGDAVGETEPVPVPAVVEQCTEMIDAEAASIETADEFRIQGDPDRVRHIFENLLANAVDHASADAVDGETAGTDEEVTVRVGRIDDRGFYVADDGPGIPEDERSDIFEPGYTTTTDGTGFGLTIVERIAEAHDWDVSVTESREGGAHFAFTDVDVVT